MKYLLCSDVILDFYIIKVMTYTSNSRCFLQPFAMDRGWRTVFDLNLHNCHQLHDVHNQGYLQEARFMRRIWQDNCIAMVIGKKLEAPNSSYSHFSEEDLTFLVSSTRVASSCSREVFAWLNILNLEKCSVAGCEIWFSQHRWHVYEYGVFLREAVIYHFKRGRWILHLKFSPYIEGI